MLGSLLFLALAPAARAQTAAPSLYLAPRTAWPVAPLEETLAEDAATLGELSTLRGDDLAPALSVLEESGWDGARFAAEPLSRRAALLRGAVKLVSAGARKDAVALPARIAAMRPGDEDLPHAIARLSMLSTSLAPYLEDASQRDAAAGALAAAWDKMETRRGGLEDALSAPGLRSPVERALSTFPLAPLVTLSLGKPEPAKEVRGKVLLLKLIRRVRLLAARPYRAALDAGRTLLTHAGELYRKYLSGRDMDAHNFRWHVVEGLHKDGDFRGSFGHPVHEGMPEVMSPVLFPAESVRAVRERAVELRPTLGSRGKGLALGPMVSISGMSFPQLSAQSVLSLLYIHVKLAKQGIRHLFNTGEGGPGLHLALLRGDRKELERRLVEWNLENKQFGEGSWAEAKVVHFVEALMDARDALFGEFGPEDLDRAQVVAQFGSALNGVRGPDGRVDFEKLKAIAADPHVAMVQYKLKQAAKRGAKVDARKIDDVVAALREIPRNRPFKSPEVNPDFDNYEDVAKLVLATKLATGKPVSLKFGVGDVKDLYDFLKFLRDADALPEHIQLDGRGEGFSPGSGNAPPGANTSLPANEAVIAADAILKKLGVRDRVFLDATGDTLLPAEAVEKLALGADGVSAARLWLGMALGCAKVKACANGNCPYGIAARSEALVGLAMDPLKIAPRGFAAAVNWWRAYTQTLGESGAADWKGLDASRGLASGRPAVRVQEGLRSVALDELYSPDRVAELLRGALTREEVERLVFRLGQ